MRANLWVRASLSFREDYVFNSNPKGSGPYGCSFCLLHYMHEAFTGSRAKYTLWVSLITLDTNKSIPKSFIRAFTEEMQHGVSLKSSERLWVSVRLYIRRRLYIIIVKLTTLLFTLITSSFWTFLIHPDALTLVKVSSLPGPLSWG